MAPKANPFDLVTFDDTGWTRDAKVEAALAGRGMRCRGWSNRDRDVLTLHFFPIPPDLPNPFPPIAEYRRSVQDSPAMPENGGVVSIRAGVEPENGLSCAPTSRESSRLAASRPVFLDGTPVPAVGVRLPARAPVARTPPIAV